MALLRTKLAPVQALVMRQPVPGMTAADLTADYAAVVKVAFVNEISAKVPSLRIKGSSSVLEKNGVRLGIACLSG